jgi:hypothetical protein
VVGTHGTIIADVGVGANARGHVRLALVAERLLEGRYAAADVLEVGEGELLARSEPADRCGQIDVAHGGEIALAEGDAVGRAVRLVEQALEGVHRPHDPRLGRLLTTVNAGQTPTTAG